MSERIDPTWGGNVDTDHLAEVLITMGEALRDSDDSILRDEAPSGFGLQGVDYAEAANHDEFVTHELTIRYAKGGGSLLADPIKYTEPHTTED